MTKCNLGIVTIDFAELSADQLRQLVRAIRAEAERRHTEQHSRPAASANAATDITTDRANEM